MKTNTKIDVFAVDNDVLEKILKKFKRSVESLDEDIHLIKQWIDTQPHLPKLLDSNCIRNFLILNRFSIEQTKQKIDKYYTVRSKLNDIYTQINPKLHFFDDLFNTIYLVSFPQLTTQLYRLFYFKIKNPDLAQNLDILALLKAILNFYEVRLREDILYGDIFIIDCSGVPLSCILKVTPVFVQRVVTQIFEGVFSIRLKGIHFINFPSSAAKVVTLCKNIITPKLFQRVHFSPDEGNFKNILPLDLIPQEMGGSGYSLENLQKNYLEKLHIKQELFERLDKEKVDESLRPVKLQGDEFLGLYGNFKKLDID